jgi:IclR family pca regulon transcriptional regulator
MLSKAELGDPWQGDPEFMTSLARGLAVLRCFADQEQSMTIAQLSQQTGLSRSAVRRCLYTLVKLGYAAQDGARYVLRPKALSLGYAYVSSGSLAAVAQPVLDRLRDELGESCSMGVIAEDQVCYIARAEASRIMAVALRAGSRLPLYPTSMGRVLLAGMTPSQQQSYLRRTSLQPLTPKTEVDPHRLLELFAGVAEEGFAIVDQELEPGLRSVAVPVRGRDGVVAAMNVGAPAARVTKTDLRTRILPALRHAAQRVEAASRRTTAPLGCH